MDRQAQRHEHQKIDFLVNSSLKRTLSSYKVENPKLPMNLGYEHLIQALGGLRVAGPITPCKIDRRVQAIVAPTNV